LDAYRPDRHHNRRRCDLPLPVRPSHGAILFGDVNVLADDGGTVLSDPTETDVGLCGTSQ